LAGSCRFPGSKAVCYLPAYGSSDLLFVRFWSISRLGEHDSGVVAEKAVLAPGCRWPTILFYCAHLPTVPGTTGMFFLRDSRYRSIRYICILGPRVPGVDILRCQTPCIPVVVRHPLFLRLFYAPQVSRCFKFRLEISGCP